jgi:SAM-dependent methyltransferase
MIRCPITGAEQGRILVSRDQILRQREWRSKFLSWRLPTPESYEIMHHDEFTNDSENPILEFASGVIARNGNVPAELGAKFEKEQYPTAVLDRLYDRMSLAYCKKFFRYRKVIRPASRVLEIGPYAGGFLEACRQNKIEALGIDINAGITEFLNNRRLDCLNISAEQCTTLDGLFDAVFIFNCFDQLPSPRAVIRAIHRKLKSNGYICIRTPNASIYKWCACLLHSIERFGGEISEDHMLVLFLGYAHLLGFPYLYGYNIDSLRSIFASEGFHHVMTYGTSLSTLPRRRMAPAFATEQRLVALSVRRAASLSMPMGQREWFAPWLELVFRKV